MAVYVERDGIEACINKINGAIAKLTEGAGEIEKAMGELPNYWKGNAYDKAQNTYTEQYQQLLTKTVPEQVDNFKKFIDNCKNTIIDIDTQLSGQ